MVISLQILELRDCKRSVKKDILEECRSGWEEPEASDDEATYALVLSGVDINQIPSGIEKVSLLFQSAAFPESGLIGKNAVTKSAKSELRPSKPAKKLMHNN